MWNPFKKKGQVIGKDSYDGIIHEEVYKNVIQNESKYLKLVLKQLDSMTWMYGIICCSLGIITSITCFFFPAIMFFPFRVSFSSVQSQLAMSIIFGIVSSLLFF